MKPEHYPQQPAHLWEHFYRFTQTPRPSGRESAVRQYVIDLAEAAGHAYRLDTQGNLVVYVPASPGREDGPTVIIQNHLDMVTVKTADREHDFASDPLVLQVEDGWLGADRTTLGADNGLGCAAALAVMTDPAVAHSALELLFTVEEETGLGGALNLDPSLLSGTLMLNLDTEDWNELYIGCAGGAGWQFSRRFSPESVADACPCWQLTLRGLAGGHSGVQIHEQLANAGKLLAEALRGVTGLRLAEIDVGTAHNVIPREGVVRFAGEPGSEERLRQHLNDLRRHWPTFLPAADHGVELELTPIRLDLALDPVDSLRLLDLVSLFPHGVQAYNLEQPADLVDLSINMAAVRLCRGELFIESSYRFFNYEQSLPLQNSVLALARAFDLEVSPTLGYPGWQPNFNSPLLEKGCDLHQRLFGERPAIKAIHAGLECGILSSKKPGVDILSFGPTIRGAHSPSERLQIDTVEPFWQFLTQLLAEL